MEKAFNELKNLKKMTDFIADTDNLKLIKQIRNKKDNMHLEKFSILNRKIYEALNETIIHKVKIINFLKGNKYPNFSDSANYELYLTPDSTKMRLFSKMLEVKKKANEIEQKLGKWDMVSK